MTIQFSTSPNVFFLHYGNYLKKTQPAKYHFYLMRYDCLINITRKNTFFHISDTVAYNSSSCPFFNCLQ